MQRVGALLHCWLGKHNSASALETGWQFLKELNIKLSYDPAIPVLGVYPEGPKTYVYRKTHTNVHSNIFLIANKMKTTQMSPADNRISKMWNSHTQ